MRTFMIAIWIAVVAATGYALFHITFQVEALEGQLAELNRQIRAEREHIHNLKAEWSYSTRLDWIETLGEQHLPELQRLDPGQALNIEDIPFRRPDPPELNTADSGEPLSDASPALPGTAEAVPTNLVKTSQ